MSDPESNRLTAVVSDPDFRCAMELSEQLGPLGFRVLQVPALEDVAAAAASHRRVLILAALPDDGGTAAKYCRAWREGRKHCYVAFLLPRYQGTEVATAFEAGADDVLVKPIVAIELRARLERAVRSFAFEEYRERLNGEAVLLSEITARSRLHSRQYLQSQLGNELDRARRFSHALSVILAEVTCARADERRLRPLGAFLNNFVRAHVDWVARHTDRTYAIVLPETTLGGAMRAAHRLRGALTQATLASTGLPVPLTISFGVSALDQVSGASLPGAKTMMESAEAFLFEAVRTGPDHIVGGHPRSAH